MRSTSPLTQANARTCDLPMVGDWSMFQADASRQGAVIAPPVREPQIAWKTRIGVQSWLNNPVIAGERVFVGSSGDVWNSPDSADGVTSLDLRTGKALWFSPFDDDVNGVAYAACTVIATSDDGTIRAMDANDGTVIWKHNVGTKVYTNPLILGEFVFVGDAEGTVHALHLFKGTVRWTHTMGAAIRGGLAGDARHVYVASQNGRVTALVAGSGAEVWSSESIAPFEIFGVPTLVRQRLVQGFVRDTTYPQPALTTFDTANGQRSWDSSNPRGLRGGWGNIRSSPAVWNGVMIWGEPYSNRIVGGLAQTGEVRWSTTAGACFFPHYSSPAIASGTAYVGRFDGGLYAFDATSGDESWRLYLGQHDKTGSFPDSLTDVFWDRCLWEPEVGQPIFASPAVAADGTIVIGTGEGWLYAIRERQ